MQTRSMALLLLMAGLLQSAGSSYAQSSGAQPTRLRITNQCSYPIYVQQDYLHATSAAEVIVNLPVKGSHDYQVPDAGIAATRFWAKAGCDANGWNCGIGESQGVPSSVSGGDQSSQTIFDAPIDSKFEGTFGCVLSDSSQCALNPSNQQPLDSTTWWDGSAVDGYTFAFQIYVKNDSGNTCKDQNSGDQVTLIDCSDLDPANCPTDNLTSGGNFNPVNGVDLTQVPLTYTAFTDGSSKIGCFSPCEILSSAQWLGWSAKLGGLSNTSNAALMYCCPTPPISQAQCNTTGANIGGTTVAPVAAQTNYVKGVHKVCNAYGYAYDDSVGLVNCAGTVQYELVYCPNGQSLPLPPARTPSTFCDSTNPQSMCPGDPPVACPNTAAACGTNPQQCQCPASS